MAQGRRAALVAALLCGVFFASGASALILENLWFRQSGLLLGNGVWATSIVLASFMAGLALGNGLAGARGHRVRNLIALYGVLELAIALFGGLVIVALPRLTGLLTPLLRMLLDAPLALNGVRLATAFLLMLVPATAMGATLPILVRALCRFEPDFGRVLGLLYGWNTLGAVAGVLTVELVLVGAFGILGSAAVAVALNALAGIAALALSRAFGTSEAEDARAEPEKEPLSPAARRLMVAAFLSGAILLALEVVWYRFLALFVLSTSLALSLMLAMILAGIGLGALLSARLIRTRAASHVAPIVAFAAGILSVLVYAAFPGGVAASQNWLDALGHAARLMLPVSLLSGMLFTLIGDAAKRELALETRAVGLVALSNTVGAMCGALLGGFVLLPTLGVESSFFWLALGYGPVALTIPRASGQPGRGFLRMAMGTSAALFVAALFLFPRGRMEKVYVPQTLGDFQRAGAELIAYREGRTETAAYLRQDYAGEPLAFRLVTNGYSMSTSYFNAQRYMKAYVYLPVAVHPDPKHALLICYGIGQTAKALTDTASFESIDVVDISREIVELGSLAYPEPGSFPLDDPRVRVRIDDGRFYLQTTSKKYDLITGEPPPPQAAGVVNLYSREYFQAVRDALAPGGLTTYWVPVHQLSVADTKAIVLAFCDAFPDASLWAGFGPDWMLVGSNGARGGVSREHFEAQWRDPVVGPELRALGFERPELIGTSFLADGEELRALAAGGEPLVDDRPQRLAHRFGPLGLERYATFRAWMDTTAARERFERSALVARLFPAEVRASTLDYFRFQPLIDELGLEASSSTPTPFAALAADVHLMLTESDLSTPILWALGVTARHVQILDGLGDEAAASASFDYLRGARALAERRYDEAARYLSSAVSQQPGKLHLKLTRLFALALAGRQSEARAAAAKLRAESPDEPAFRSYWGLMAREFGL